MNPPSFLANEDPIQALYHHFNVSHSFSAPTPPLADTFDVPVLHDAHMPTHILAATEPDAPHCPLMTPVHADLYNHNFRVRILPQAPPGTALPVPHATSPASPAALTVTLPVVALSVPHLASLPLLLLFALRLETQRDLLAARLLPSQAIEEFPNAAAMAQAMVRVCGERALGGHVQYNQGLWKNVLALGLRDRELVQMVQTAWNVTVEARRIWERQRHRV